MLDALTGADADRPLHVATTPSFASNWLMPRLASFSAAHPDIDIMINPSPQITDPSPGGKHCGNKHKRACSDDFLSDHF